MSRSSVRRRSLAVGVAEAGGDDHQGPYGLATEYRPDGEQGEADRGDRPAVQRPPLLGTGTTATTSAATPPPASATRPAGAAGRNPQTVSR